MNSALGGARQSRRTWRRVDGVLLLDKGLDVSSNHALQAARRLFNAEKAGHTGTLDPMATGLLPLCFGEATKFAGELLNADKRYTARLRLGITTDTADAEGRVLETRPVAASLARIESVLTGFVGEISQVPPMYSALKRDGRPLYEYARAGVELVREPRNVTIFELRLLSWEAPDLEFEVRCSKGTYVRTLGADLGEQLGCGGHLIGLRRTGIGGLDVADAFSLEQLQGMPDGARDAALAAPDSLLSDLDPAVLDEEQARRMCHGQAVAWPGADGRRLRLYGPGGQFIGVARTTAESLLVAQRLVATS
jgi:tRNA pseudouridine55 synthase